MPVKCFASDTCIVQDLGHHTDFVGGRWPVTGKFIFLISSVCSLQSGGLSVSLAALPIKRCVQYQLLKANVFLCGVFAAKGLPLCARLMQPAQVL